MSGKFLNKEIKQKNQIHRQFQKTAMSVIKSWIIFLVVTTIILLNLFTHVFQIVRYSGNGMEPNLSSGQILLLRKTQGVEEGDIISVTDNGRGMAADIDAKHKGFENCLTATAPKDIILFVLV